MKEAYIWELVKRSVFYHMNDELKTKLGIASSDELTGDMRLDWLYPHQYSDSKNRLGIAVLDCLKHMNKPPAHRKRSEYFTFPTLEALWDYLVAYEEGC